MMNRKTVRRIFIFFIFFLPFQYGLVGLVSLSHSEPWPAFLFPGFKNIYVYDPEIYRISDMEFNYYVAGEEKGVVISPLELFSDIPRSQFRGFLQSNFMEEESILNFDADTREWLRERAEKSYPGIHFEGVEVVQIDYFYNRSTPAALPDSIVETNRIQIPFNP